jgi:hypothetical protein
VLLLIVGLVVAVPIRWAVSAGALREVRRARELDPRQGCQAWVAVPRVRDRLYRCGEPVYAGGGRCLRHETGRAPDAGATHPDARRVDEPQAVGRALALARVGVPLATLAAVAATALVVWAVARGT